MGVVYVYVYVWTGTIVERELAVDTHTEIIYLWTLYSLYNIFLTNPTLLEQYFTEHVTLSKELL